MGRYLAHLQSKYLKCNVYILCYSWFLCQLGLALNLNIVVNWNNSHIDGAALGFILIQYPLHIQHYIYLFQFQILGHPSALFWRTRESQSTDFKGATNVCSSGETNSSTSNWETYKWYDSVINQYIWRDNWKIYCFKYLQYLLKSTLKSTSVFKCFYWSSYLFIHFFRIFRFGGCSKKIPAACSSWSPQSKRECPR